MNQAALLLESLEGLTFESYIDLSNQLTKLNKINIDDVLSKQATFYSYYGGLESEAKRQEDIIKKDIDIYSADEYTRYKDSKKGSMKKPTAKDIESYIMSTPRYEELQSKLISASFKRSLLGKLLRALDHRRDMAVQIAAKARSEMSLS